MAKKDAAEKVNVYSTTGHTYKSFTIEIKTSVKCINQQELG